MVQSISSDNSNIVSPEEMHRRVLMKAIYSYDKDTKTGMSKAELSQYVSDSEFGGGKAPEFAQKLLEKFNEVDKNKDGQLSSNEVNSLVNYRGLWQINPTSSTSSQSAASAITATSGSSGTTNLLSNNIQGLVKKGLNYAKNNPQVLSKIEDIFHKIV